MIPPQSILSVVDEDLLHVFGFFTKKPLNMVEGKIYELRQIESGSLSSNIYKRSQRPPILTSMWTRLGSKFI